MGISNLGYLIAFFSSLLTAGMRLAFAIEGSELFAGQLDGCGGHVLFEVRHLRCPRGFADGRPVRIQRANFRCQFDDASTFN